MRQKESQEQGTVVGGRGRRYLMGRWGIRSYIYKRDERLSYIVIATKDNACL